MRREFFINILLLFVLNLLIKPLYIFGIELPVQNLVGTEDYGLYFSLISFIYFFQFINDFGLNHLIRKKLSADREDASQQFPYIITLKVALSVFFILALLLGNYLLGYEVEHVYLLLIIGLNFAMMTIIQTYRSGLASMGHFREDSLLSSLDKGLLILLVSPFLLIDQLTPSFSIYTFVCCQLVTLLLTLGVSAFLYYARHKSSVFLFSIVEIRKYLALSFPFAMMIFLMSVYSRIDGFMLRELLEDGLYQAGSYAAAFRLYDAANMFAILLGTLLLPMSSYIVSVKESLNALLNSSIRLMLIMTIVPGLIVFYYGEQIMDLLYDDYSQGWGNNLTWLMIGFIPLGFTHIFGVLLISTNRISALNKVYLIGLVLNISLNLWLIPVYKASGAAMATAFTQVYILGSQVYLFSKAQSWTLFRKSEIFVFMAASVLVTTMIACFTGIFWIWGMIFAVVALTLLAILSNMVPVKEVINRLKEDLQSS